MSSSSVSEKIGNYRWRICAVLFLATTINYIDRNVVSSIVNEKTFRSM